MNKEETLKRRMQLSLLPKMIKSINFEIQLLKQDKEKSEEEKQEKFNELIEKLFGIENKINEIRRNKFNSSFYKLEPFIGLNRKQRRAL